MKHILLINGDLFKTDSTEFLISAYAEGAAIGKHKVRRLAIADQLFNFNKQFATSNLSSLESDLQSAWQDLIWADHIVLFCPVFSSYVPSKISGFFDRLFAQIHQGEHVVMRNGLYGRSGRIVSILDQRLFDEWKNHKVPSFMTIKKEVFERANIHPVHSATIGELHSLENDYSDKWTKKMVKFGMLGM